MPAMLLTGASGFLGGHLLEKASPHWRLTALSHTHPLPGTLALDLRDREAVMALVRDRRPRVILHAAANANLDACQRNPQEAAAVNTATVATLLEAAIEVKARLILVSTDMVFDGARGFYSEEDEVHPLSVYGATKVEAERLVLASPGRHLVARAALIYGRPRHGGSSFSQWIENRLLNGQPVPLYTDQFRSPIWVENLAEALLELAGMEYAGLIHLGGANRIDRYTFATQLCSAAGYDPALLQPVSMHTAVSDAPRPVDVSLDSSRAAALLRTPLLDTRDGLLRMTRAR